MKFGISCGRADVVGLTRKSRVQKFQFQIQLSKVQGLSSSSKILGTDNTVNSQDLEFQFPTRLRLQL